MTNLLAETVEAIKTSGHKPTDIVFIGSEESGHRCTWAEFQALADRQYDSGFGAQEVATDLIVVFSDGSKLWREEYDGSEGWSPVKPFVPPSESKPITSLFVSEKQVGWRDLAEINRAADHASAEQEKP